MPIRVRAETRLQSQEEFGQVAFDVMNRVFQVHNELGRFLDERIYANVIAQFFQTAKPEVAIDVTFDDFSKMYFLDLLVDGGAVFEFKAVRRLDDRHRSQLLNYLLMTELPRGKLINLRPEMVEHEFVNTTLTHDDRVSFDVRDEEWDVGCPGQDVLHDLLIDALRDWGTGLDIALYIDALTHFLGGPERVLGDVDICFDERPVGRQKFRLSAPDTAFRSTAIPQEGQSRFEDHTRRLLSHSMLDAVQWINITRPLVTFRTIRRKSR